MTPQSIRWRWKSARKWNEGFVQQEMRDLIKMKDEWYLKADIDIGGYEEKVK